MAKIDDILNATPEMGEPEAVAQQEAAKEEAAPAPVAPQPTEPPAVEAKEERKEDKPKPEFIPLPTFLDMRDARKRAEAEAAELRARIEAMEAEKNSAPIDWYADPDAAMSRQTEKIASRIGEIEGRLVEQQNALRLRASELDHTVRFGADTVSAAKKAAEAAIAANDPSIPGLAARMQQSPDPFAEVLAWHNSRPETIEARIRAEYEAKYAGAAPAEQQPAKQPNIALPTNLAAARSAAPRTGPAWSGPKPLDDIIPR